MGVRVPPGMLNLGDKEYYNMKFLKTLGGLILAVIGVLFIVLVIKLAAVGAFVLLGG